MERLAGATKNTSTETLAFRTSGEGKASLGQQVG
jgi:hypothetical protein